ncbi:MAG: His/Gly/Thr/Pro-type tRNA ligase C-terminal domain-containing protein, partial [Patescibacteria group bacterium]
KLEKQLKYSDRKGFRYALILGPEEAKTGRVTVKDLQKGTQNTFPQESLLAALKER